MKATVLQGDVFQLLPTIAAGSVDACVTSPPYWRLRSYLGANHPLKSLELGSEPVLDCGPARSCGECYLCHLVRVFALVRETMADHGTCWLNIGDSYAAGKEGNDSYGSASSTLNNGKANTKTGDKMPSKQRKPPPGIAAGNLCLVPQRLALALQADNWFVRSVIVWRKPSPMPASLSGWQWRKCRVKTKAQPKGTRQKIALGENTPYDRDQSGGIVNAARAEYADCPGCKRCSATNGLVLRRGSWRPTSSWEPILMLAKSATYFADGEPVRTPAASSTISRDLYSRVAGEGTKSFIAEEQGVLSRTALGLGGDHRTPDTFAVRHDHETTCQGGANARDVLSPKLEDMTKEELIDVIREMTDAGSADVQTWSSEALREKHYAAFPSKLVEWALRAGTSAHGYCAAPGCGKPWARVVESEFRPTQDPANGKAGSKGLDESDGRGEWPRGVTDTQTTGWRPTCSCPPHKPRPGLVLDPFAGSCRTGLEARRLGLDFVGVELNPEYAAMSRRLLHAEMPLFSEVSP